MSTTLKRKCFVLFIYLFIILHKLKHTASGPVVAVTFSFETVVSGTVVSLVVVSLSVSMGPEVMVVSTCDVVDSVGSDVLKVLCIVVLEGEVAVGDDVVVVFVVVAGVVVVFVVVAVVDVVELSTAESVLVAKVEEELSPVPVVTLVVVDNVVDNVVVVVAADVEVVTTCSDGELVDAVEVVGDTGAPVVKDLNTIHSKALTIIYITTNL